MVLTALSKKRSPTCYKPLCHGEGRDSIPTSALRRSQPDPVTQYLPSASFGSSQDHGWNGICAEMQGQKGHSSPCGARNVSWNPGAEKCHYFLNGL